MPVALATVPAAAADQTLGQLWKYNETGGYWFAPNLTNELRSMVQKRCRFRQFADIKSDIQGGTKNKGDTVHWNIYSEVEAAIDTTDIDEEGTLPKTRMQAKQNSASYKQYGLSVDYTGLLDDLSEHPVRDLIKQKLRIHCARKLDLLAYKEFERTLLKVGPTGGTSATAIVLDETGTAPVRNNAPLTWAHCKEVARLMRERDIPVYDHGDYYVLARPYTYSVVEDDLEAIHKYTDPGFKLIRDGEKGRAAGLRMVEQTNTSAADSALGTAWADGRSDQAFFFGDDQVTECVAIPEEIRGKIPGNYGLDKGVGWYALLTFAKTRIDAVDERCIEWSSNA